MHEYTIEAYVMNLGKYTESNPVGEWVRFPITPEEKKALFDRIAIDGINYEEYFISEYKSNIKELTRFLGEHENLDELNYLGGLIEKMDNDSADKFSAALIHGEYAGNLQYIINLAQNLDCYELYPTVSNNKDYGYFLVDELGRLDLSDDVKMYFDYERYGEDTTINDGGSFTDIGYVYNNRSEFTEHYNGLEVPEEYKLTPPPEAVIKKTLQDDKLLELSDAADLAFDLDEFFRAKSHHYSNYFRDIHERKEEIADRLLNGNTFGIRNLFRNLQQGPNDELPRRLYEFETLYNKYIMPDTTITLEERNQYGYNKENNILPLRQDSATDLYNYYDIYMLFNNNEKIKVYDSSQILEHKGIFGIDRCDWEKSLDFLDQLEARTRQGTDLGKSEEIYYNSSGKAFSIMTGHLGNGLTVWNTLDDKNGDYVMIAHIGADRSVTYYEKNLPQEVKARIEETARTSTATISETQDNPVFNMPPILEKEPIKIPEDKRKELQAEITKTMQFFIDSDLKTKGKVSDVTFETLRVQGYTYKDGKLEFITDNTAMQDNDQIITRIPSTLTVEPPEPIIAQPFIFTEETNSERIKIITDKLEQGVKDLFEDKKYMEYLTAMSKFHNYSANNTILIAMQNPKATRVAGFTTWKNEFKRYPKKGEKGIKILAPAPYKTKKEIELLDPVTQKPMLDENGNPVMETVEAVAASFKVATVFDVSQTEGEDIPNIGVNELMGNVDNYKDFLTALEKTSPFPIEFKPIEGGIKGYCNYEEKRIAILEGASELQTIKTLIHEISHAKLHNIDTTLLPHEQELREDKSTIEVQAESVAYTVCQHYGLETSDYSFNYIAGWSSGKETKELKASLEIIRKTAAELINTIDGHLIALQKDREQHMPELGETFVIENDNPAKPTHEIPTPTLEGTDNSYSIYQLKHGDETRYYRYEPLDRLQALKLNVERSNYEHIYTAELTDTTTLESIYTLYNTHHPEDFKGHSLSMSDIIVINKDGKETAHYVDRYDFHEVPEFFNEQPELINPASVPTVTITFTESDGLNKGEKMPILQADEKFKSLDMLQKGQIGYDKTDFNIEFVINNENHIYKGLQDLGDGEGGIIDHIKNTAEYYRNSKSWQTYYASNGKDELEKKNQGYDFTIKTLVPYLSLHCVLSGMEQTAISGLIALNINENLSEQNKAKVAYFEAMQQYVHDSRVIINTTDSLELPPPPSPEAFYTEQAPLVAEEKNTISEKEHDTQPNETNSTVKYYPINEEAARRAKEANSFSDYKKGSATAEYRSYIDKAAEIAEKQKTYTEPSLHEKIDGLLDTYARKLAENMNNRFSIDARVPSILISGGGNFPVRAKEKQNNARDKNHREWQDIQGLLDKIQSTGMGGISADDPKVIQKLETKLENLKKSQETMKSVNAYYRKYKTLDGCPDLKGNQIEELKVSMSRDWRTDPKPFETYSLTNNNAEIHRTEARIKELKQRDEIGFSGWEFEGGKVEVNKEANRLQVFFDDKPDESKRAELKGNGFKWSPNAGAWQRQLNSNAIFAANYVECIKPITGETPRELQKRVRLENKQQETQNSEMTIDKYIENGSTTNFEISSAVNSHYMGMVALIGTDDKVYLGKAENYHFISSVVMPWHNPQQEYGNKPSYYDNSDNSLLYVSDNKQIYHFLYGDGLTISQAEAIKQEIYTESDYNEFARIQAELSHLEQKQEFLFDGKSFDPNPLNYLATAEKSTEQNYNQIDGIINNTPTVAELQAKAKAGEQISLLDLSNAIKEEKQPNTKEKPSILKQLKANKAQTMPKNDIAKAKSKNVELG